MESQSVSGEELKWTAELEVALFHSMHGHKPVGEFGSRHVVGQSRFNRRMEWVDSEGQY